MMLSTVPSLTFSVAAAKWVPENVYMTAGITLAVYCLISTLHNIISNSIHLRRIPGPWWARYTRLWLLRALCAEHSSEHYMRVNEQYGPLARIGPNHLITSDPELFRHILNVRSTYQRGAWFDCLRLNPFHANLITERDRQKHNALRAQLTAGYQLKDVEFERILDVNLAEWMSYVERHGLSGPGKTCEFEIARSIQWLLFDMVSRLCFGHPFGFIEKHEDCYDFQKMLDERLPIVEKFAILTEVNTWLRLIASIPILRNVIPSPRDTTGVGAILGLAEHAVKQHTDGHARGEDMIASWLRRGVDPKLATTEITIALFAGSDTTAITIRSVLLHVITNPLVYARLKEELALAAGRGLISASATEAEIKQLPYLQACIKEGLRVYPPVVALRDRLVPEGGDTLRGTFVPGGTNIGLNLPALLRNEVFGSDPDVFRPERWLEADAEQVQRMERVHELVFNYGFTRCLGIRLATAMIGKFFVEVFRRWDLVSTRPRQPWRSHEHGIPYQQDFYVRITKAEERNNNNNNNNNNNEVVGCDLLRSLTPPYSAPGTPPLQ